MFSIIKRNKLITAILLFFVILYGVSKVVHFNQYRSFIEEQLTTEDLEFKINGNIEFEIFPMPHLELNDVVVSYKDETIVSADKIRKGGLNPFKHEVQNLTIVNATLNYSILNQYIESSDQQQNVKLLTKLKLKNVDVLLGAGGKINNVKGVIDYTGKKFIADFDAIYKRVPLQFQLKLANITPEMASKDVTFKIKSDDFTVNFVGEGFDLFSKNNFDGKLKTEFQNFTFLTTLFNLDIEELSYIDNENLNFSADFKYVDFITLDNILIDSANIKNLKSSINITPNLRNVIDISVDSIDMDGLFGTERSEVMRNSFLSLLSNFNRTIPDTEVDFSAEIKNIKINNQNVTDFTLYADLVNGIITVSELSMIMPGDTATKVIGIISHNDIRPIFEGELNFASNKFNEFLTWIGNENEQYTKLGNDLLFKSEVIIIPHRMILSDIKGVLDNKTFQGKYYLKDSNVRGVNLNLAMKISELPLETFGFSSKLEQKLIDLAIAENDKSGEYYSKITQDFLSLRKLRGIYDIDLEVGKLTIADHELKDFRFDARIFSGTFDIKSILVKDDKSDFNMFARITIPRIRPQINFGIEGAKFDKSTIDAIFPKYSQTLTKARAKAKLLEQQTAARGLNAERFATFPDLNLFGMSHLDGAISFDIKELTWGEIELKDVKSKADMKNSVLHLHKLGAKQGRGEITLNGNLVLITVIPNASLNFSFNNISPSFPIYIVTGAEGLVEGYFSIVGSIVTSGVTFREWGRKLAGKAQFAGKKIDYNGFDIAKITEIPDLGISYEGKLQRLDYYQKYGTSNFDDVKGKISLESGIATISEGTFTTSRSNGIFVGNYDILSGQLVSKSRFNFFSRSSNIPISIDISTSGVFANRQTVFDNTKMIEFITARSSANRQNQNERSGTADSLLNSRLR